MNHTQNFIVKSGTNREIHKLEASTIQGYKMFQKLNHKFLDVS